MGRELYFLSLKDFSIQWFSGTGAGEQHRNKHKNCCRLIHKDSGAISVGQNSRSRETNLKDSIRSIKEKPEFKIWFNRKVAEALTGMSLRDKIKEETTPDKLLIEEIVGGNLEEVK